MLLLRVIQSQPADSGMGGLSWRSMGGWERSAGLAGAAIAADERCR